MITKEQCRAARSLLGLKQIELADACGMSKTAITNFESGSIATRQDTQRVIRNAFEQKGIEFVGDYGVQKRQSLFKVISGADMMPELWDDIFYALKDTGGELLISNLDDRSAFQAHPELLTAHIKRLKEHNITERLLVCRGDTFFIQNPECYRWLSPEVYRAGMASFLYGGRLAIQFWDGGLTLIVENPEIFQKEKQRFEYLWDDAEIPPYEDITSAYQSNTSE